MKKLIVCLVMLCATMAYATNDDVVNSQMYVDNAVGNLQTNLPAKTSDKVVTYTTTAGTTGERDIKTTLGNETTNQADTGIPTIGTVNTAVDGKQNKLNPLNNVNIVTYTGSTASAYNGPGIATTTPIYDSTVNTFDNGLVRAKTLNDAVIAGVNAEATKITTDPKGALWQFNRTAPKVLPTTANLPANIGGANWCHKNVIPDQYPDRRGDCSSAMYDNFSRGDWGATFIYNTGITYDTTCTGSSCGKEVRGISACILSTFNGYGYGVHVPSTETGLITTLNQAYESGKNGDAPNNAHCYCKLSAPYTSDWVYRNSYAGSYHCSARCAFACASDVALVSGMRGALFGAAPVSAAAPAQ